MKEFPKFKRHEEAYCFNCQGDFGDRGWPFKSGYADGRGQYVQGCEKCGLSTYYDVESNNDSQ